MAAIEKKPNTGATPEKLDQGTVYTPLVDIIEGKEAFTFLADMPGVKAGDLDVRFENGVLTLDGKVQLRQPREQGYLWQEYGVGGFHRCFTIDTPIHVEGIKAELKNGELKLYVPKAEAAKTRKIQIKSA